MVQCYNPQQYRAVVSSFIKNLRIIGNLHFSLLEYKSIAFQVANRKFNRFKNDIKNGNK